MIKHRLYKFICFCLIGLFSTFVIHAETLHVVLVGDLYDINPKKNGRGGYAKLAKVLNNTRDRGKTIFVHAGDAFSPSLISSLTKGAHVVRLLNATFLDYFVPGNHEFDFGTDIALENLSKAKFKVLAGNIMYTPPPLPEKMTTTITDKNNKVLGEATLKVSGNEITPEATMLPNTIKTDIIDFNGIKIGIYGLLTPRTASLNPNSRLTILPLIKSAETFYNDLKKNGAEFIIALVQTNMQEDMAIINSGFADTVLSGDDHVDLTFNNGKITWLESGEDAKNIAVLTVEFQRDDKGKLTWEQTVKSIDTKYVQEDVPIKKIVREYNQLLEKEFSKEIGVTAVELNSERAVVRTAESNMGNLIADALKEKLKTDIAIANGGGIRGNKTYPAGSTLTRKDILAELPFGNVGTSIRVKGSVILEALENGVSEVENGAGRFPQVSGIEFDWSMSAPQGNRIKNVNINGEPLNKNKLYTVAINDYIMSGGDNYTMFKDAEVIVDASAAELFATIVIEYIEKIKKLSPKVEGRINRLD